MGGSVLEPLEVAAILGVSERTLRRWRVSGLGPKFVRHDSGRYHYLRSDVVAYLAKQSRGGK